MKAVLVRVETRIYWIDGEGKTREGAPSGVSGDLSGVYGNLSRVSGNLSGVYGNLSGVYGDLSKAEITDEDRKRRINVEELVRPDEEVS